MQASGPSGASAPPKTTFQDVFHDFEVISMAVTHQEGKIDDRRTSAVQECCMPAPKWITESMVKIEAGKAPPAVMEGFLGLQARMCAAMASKLFPWTLYRDLLLCNTPLLWGHYPFGNLLMVAVHGEWVEIASLYGWIIPPKLIEHFNTGKHPLQWVGEERGFDRNKSVVRFRRVM
jgi:hypothetical protein